MRIFRMARFTNMLEEYNRLYDFEFDDTFSESDSMFQEQEDENVDPFDIANDPKNGEESYTPEISSKIAQLQGRLQSDYYNAEEQKRVKIRIIELESLRAKIVHKLKNGE